MDEALLRSAGEKLYVENCQACHGELTVSTKHGRTAAQIRTAIAGIPQMQTLSFLSAADQENLARALAPAKAIGQPKYACTQPALRGTADKMRRLTKYEIANSLNRIFGAAFLASQGVDFNTLPEEFRTNRVKDFVAAHSDAQVSAMLEIGQKIGAGVEGSATLKTTFGGTCMSVTPATDDCVKGFIGKIGKALFRRPLTADEVSVYLTYYKQATVTPLTVIVSTMTQSPYFLFQLENGDDSRLTQYEIASRLSFRLTATSPDDLLMAAADRGELSDATKAMAQADRLLNTDAGKAQLQSFFGDYASLFKVPTVLAATPGLPDQNVSALHDDMINDYRDFVDQLVIQRNLDFRSLMITPSAFPRTARLASIYGSAVWKPGDAPVVAAGHPGILLRPALLASGGLDTNIIQRGVRVRREFLCDTIASPSQDVVNMRQTETEVFTREKYSNREIIGNLTSPVSCAGCHATMINPLGFVLENFGQFGQLRQQQIVTDATGQVLATHPIDTRVASVALDEGVTASIDDAGALIRSLADGVKARACFAKQVYQFAKIRPEQTADACALADLEASLAQGKGVRTVFMESVVNSDLYLKVK